MLGRLLLLVLVLALLLPPLTLRLPARLDPFAPLDLKAPRDFLTGFRLWRLEHDPGLCRAVLAQAPLAYRLLPDANTGGQCPLIDTVRVSAVNGIRLASPVILTCPMAAALTLWSREALGGAATRALGSPVTRIDHLGSYACRTMRNGRASTRLSQHATANALDVAGFGLADGRTLRISRDWPDADAAGRFLHNVRDRACQAFSVTLSPDYNALHRDHLHLDMGGFGLCR